MNFPKSSSEATAAVDAMAYGRQPQAPAEKNQQGANRKARRAAAALVRRGKRKAAR